MAHSFSAAMFDFDALSEADGLVDCPEWSAAGSSGDPPPPPTGGAGGSAVGAGGGLSATDSSLPTEKDWAVVTPGSGGGLAVVEDDAVSWSVAGGDQAVSVSSSGLANYVAGTAGQLHPARSMSWSDAGGTAVSVSEADWRVHLFDAEALVPVPVPRLGPPSIASGGTSWSLADDSFPAPTPASSVPGLADLPDDIDLMSEFGRGRGDLPFQGVLEMAPPRSTALFGTDGLAVPAVPAQSVASVRADSWAALGADFVWSGLADGSQAASEPPAAPPRGADAAAAPGGPSPAAAQPEFGPIHWTGGAFVRGPAPGPVGARDIRLVVPAPRLPGPSPASPHQVFALAPVGGGHGRGGHGLAAQAQQAVRTGGLEEVVGQPARGAPWVPPGEPDRRWGFGRLRPAPRQGDGDGGVSARRMAGVGRPTDPVYFPRTGQQPAGYILAIGHLVQEDMFEVQASDHHPPTTTTFQRQQQPGPFESGTGGCEL